MARRARAGDSVGWNASFVRSDTVVDALADRLGVGKSDILDREEVSTGPRATPTAEYSTVWCWGVLSKRRWHGSRSSRIRFSGGIADVWSSRDTYLTDLAKTREGLTRACAAPFSWPACFWPVPRVVW